MPSNYSKQIEAFLYFCNFLMSGLIEKSWILIPDNIYTVAALHFTQYQVSCTL